MDSSALLYTLLGIFIIAIGRCKAAEVKTDDKRTLECYECVYYRGEMELNPQCKEIGEDSEGIAKTTDCQFCKTVIAKMTTANYTRTLIKRQCDRFCVDGKDIDVSYQDMKDVPGKEYCCEKDLCNVGDNAISNHKGPALLLLLSAILSFLIMLQ